MVGGPSWHDGLVTSWGPELGLRHTQPQDKETWRGGQGSLLLRENTEMGRQGQGTSHYVDTGAAREHQHLGQQVLTWTVPGQGTGEARGTTPGLDCTSSGDMSCSLDTGPWSAPTQAGPAPAPQVLSQWSPLAPQFTQTVNWETLLS